MNDETQAIRCTGKARMVAAASLLRHDKPDAAEPMIPDKVTAGYATKLLGELCEPAVDQCTPPREQRASSAPMRLPGLSAGARQRMPSSCASEPPR